jgi:hypothetical protein
VGGKGSIRCFSDSDVNLMFNAFSCQAETEGKRLNQAVGEWRKRYITHAKACDDKALLRVRIALSEAVCKEESHVPELTKGADKKDEPKEQQGKEKFDDQFLIFYRCSPQFVEQLFRA